MLPPQNGAEAVRVPLLRIGGAGEASIAGFDQEGRRIIEGTARSMGIEVRR